MEDKTSPQKDADMNSIESVDALVSEGQRESDTKKESEASKKLQSQYSHRRPSMSSTEHIMPNVDGWSPMRIQVWILMHNKRYDNIMGMIIVFNVILMLFEAQWRAECYPDECRRWYIDWLNRLLLVIYTFEAAGHLYTDRVNYHRSMWNILDLIIVTTGWFDEIMTLITPQGDGIEGFQVLPILRILRVARLMRAIKWIRFHPELYVMIRGFFGAIKAMFWGFVLIIGLLAFWSLISVEVVHPINHSLVKEMRAESLEVDPDCEEAFSSLFLASLLYFQTLVAGDSWGTCLVPIVKYSPATFLIFAIALVSVSLGFMNLILAVIVDNACAARDGDKEEQVRKHKMEEAQMLQTWKELIVQIDGDGNGTITREEMLNAYNVPEVCDTLEMMGIGEDDLMDIFNLLDADGSGDLNYDEFINAFLKAQGQDLRIYLMTAKIQVDAIAKTMKQLQQVVKDLDAHQSSKDVKLEDLEKLLNEPLEMTPILSNAPNWTSPDTEATKTNGGAGPAHVLKAEAESFEADFKSLTRNIQEQFALLNRNIQMNTATMCKHTKAVESAAVKIAACSTPQRSTTTKGASKGASKVGGRQVSNEAGSHDPGLQASPVAGVHVRDDEEFTHIAV